MKPSSTLAMSAYNVLAVAGAPRLTEHLRALLQVKPTLAELDTALQEMRRRGWIHNTPHGWDVRDAKRRIVRVRDLSDGEMINGEVRGGWNGWLVQCAQRGMMTIEDAIAEGRSREVTA